MTAVEILLLLVCILFTVAVTLAAALLAACLHYNTYRKEREAYINNELELLKRGEIPYDEREVIE